MDLHICVRWGLAAGHLAKEAAFSKDSQAIPKGQREFEVTRGSTLKWQCVYRTLYLDITEGIGMKPLVCCFAHLQCSKHGW